MVMIMWGEDQVSIYLCAWHVLKVWHLHLMEIIKNNGVQHVILEDFHIVMYMPIEPDESIETFMTCGEKKSLKVSLNICPMIHGFDIFGPIISKLVCELTLSPLFYSTMLCISQNIHYLN